MAQRVLARPFGFIRSPTRMRPFSTVIDAPIDPRTQRAVPYTGQSSSFEDARQATAPRTNWTKEEISQIYNTPLIELTYASVCWSNPFPRLVIEESPDGMCFRLRCIGASMTQPLYKCSSRYDTGLKATKMSSVDSVLEAARIAKQNGSSRFCMGAAWRDMRGRKTNLKNIKAMVTGVRALGMEACVTLGMLDAEQAKELKAAGLTAYNHNVDTSREHYPNVITTRTYDERLNTIKNVQEAGIHVCTGGILGLGERARDHVGLIHTVATLPAHPESFPVNALVPIKGTPLGESQVVSFDAILRTIATARMVMPRTIIRLAAGRHTMREEKQMLCFQAGANAVFTGEKMLTTACNGWEEDKAMFERWGLRPMAIEETLGGNVEGIEQVSRKQASGSALEEPQQQERSSVM
ncbi:Nn.00g114370.m01.CDS01 [Neocucurbitaria sp. VM-36]